MLTNKPSRNRVCCLLPGHGRSKQVFASTQQSLSRVTGAVMCSLLEHNQQEPDLCDGFARTAVNGGSDPRVRRRGKPPSVLFGLSCCKVSCRFSTSQEHPLMGGFQGCQNHAGDNQALSADGACSMVRQGAAHAASLLGSLGRKCSSTASLTGLPALDSSFQGDHTAGKLTWIALQALNPNSGVFWGLQSEAAGLAGLGQLIVPIHQHRYCLDTEISPGCRVLQPQQVRMCAWQGTRCQALAPREVVNHHPWKDFEKLVCMAPGDMV